MNWRVIKPQSEMSAKTGQISGIYGRNEKVVEHEIVTGVSKNMKNKTTWAGDYKNWKTNSAQF